ncbi:MAG TPA: hypothetical protein VJ417_12575, partial [Candidatus Glassbacteria bacterium]|nr:hypothetical protein [Candidatus Glassbacteria bacterium]
MKPRALTALILLAVVPGTANAATEFDLGGVLVRHKGLLRNVFTSGRTIDLPFISSERYAYDLQRVRSDWLFTFRNKFSLAAVYDHQAEAGSYLPSFEYRTFVLARPVELADLGSWIIGRREFNWRQRLYRAYVEYDRFPLRFSAGRQQISWGAGYFWNPTDLFNPVSFALVEMAERHGVDAMELEVGMGSLSQVQAVWAWGRTPQQARGALRFKTNLADYDFSLMAGRYFRDEVVGADFSGQIGGAGFRGEWLHDFSQAGDDFDQLVLGWDYRFTGRWTVTGEYLFNSGELSAGELLAAVVRSRAGGVLSTSSHLAGLYADYQVHPLVHLTGYGSIDMEHGGAFLGPRVSWSVTQNTGIEA